VPFDPGRDAWHAPAQCVHAAGYVAALIACVLACGWPVPEDLDAGTGGPLLKVACLVDHQHQRPGPRPRLHAGEPARDPPHQVIELFPPPGRVYAEPSGHRQIVMCPHKP
jgi:hypothetical protein